MSETEALHETIQRLQAEVRRYQRAEEILRAIAEGTAAATGDDFFYALAYHLALTLRVDYAFMTECGEPGSHQVRTLACWQKTAFVQNFEYALTGTPCESVIHQDAPAPGEQPALVYFASHVQQLCPDEAGIESYLQNEVYGCLLMLDDAPRDFSDEEKELGVLLAALASLAIENTRLRKKAAAMEEVTLAPALTDIPLGADDSFASAVERIFPVVNRPVGTENPQRQGFNSALAGEGGPLNTLGGGAFGSVGIIVNCPVVFRFLSAQDMFRSLAPSRRQTSPYPGASVASGFLRFAVGQGRQIRHRQPARRAVAVIG